MSKNAKKVLLVVTNVSHYDIDPSHPTGLWLSELTHAYDIFEKHGYEQTIVSPSGGKSPLEPRSLKFPTTTNPRRHGTTIPREWHCLSTQPARRISMRRIMTRYSSPAATL